MYHACYTKHLEISLVFVTRLDCHDRILVKIEETNLKMYMETTIELYVSWKWLEYFNKELISRI